MGLSSYFLTPFLNAWWCLPLGPLKLWYLRSLGGSGFCSEKKWKKRKEDFNIWSLNHLSTSLSFWFLPENKHSFTTLQVFFLLFFPVYNKPGEKSSRGHSILVLLRLGRVESQPIKRLFYLRQLCTEDLVWFVIWKCWLLHQGASLGSYATMKSADMVPFYLRIFFFFLTNYQARTFSDRFLLMEKKPY